MEPLLLKYFSMSEMNVFFFVFFENLFKESGTKNLNMHHLLVTIHDKLCTPLIISCLQWSGQAFFTK